MSAIRKITVVFFLTVCLPVAGLCDTAGAATCDAGTPRKAEMRSLLNIYSAFTDEYFNNVLRGLRLLASTHEVGSGRWDDMKGLLTEFDKSGIAAAAVWYARPDGSYYTVEKGRAAEALADRPYFHELMAGNDITGYLVISRSTGKRSAVFAVPVKRGGRVIGALGVSLSVDEASRMLNKKMELPKDFVFYALDKEGRVSLHWKPELIFEYPSDLGSKTLDEAVAKMMSEREGEVSYEFQGRKVIYFKRSPLTGWVYALGIVTNP